MLRAAAAARGRAEAEVAAAPTPAADRRVARRPERRAHGGAGAAPAGGGARERARVVPGVDHQRRGAAGRQDAQAAHVREPAAGRLGERRGPDRAAGVRPGGAGLRGRNAPARGRLPPARRPLGAGHEGRVPQPRHAARRRAAHRDVRAEPGRLRRRRLRADRGPGRQRAAPAMGHGAAGAGAECVRPGAQQRTAWWSWTT